MAGPQTPSTARSDDRVIAEQADLVGAYRNVTSWYNNASFLLPLAAAVLIGLLGLLTRRGEFLGFAAFLGIVTLVMLPVVLLTWRHTATAVLLTESGMLSLHRGRLLQELKWTQVSDIRCRETQGNVRWEVTTVNGERILLDGEIEHLPELIETARRLSGRGARIPD